MFLENGYAATTMPAIANTAGIALDTVYATVGKKPALFRLLVEMAISGDKAVPAEAPDYVRAIRAEPDAARKLQLYAAALRAIQPRLAPLIRVLQGAAPLIPNWMCCGRIFPGAGPPTCNCWPKIWPQPGAFGQTLPSPGQQTLYGA